MTAPMPLPDGPWQGLFRHALTLIDEIRIHGTANPFWTFGGGTVLMLRYGHRMSKDIDIFVPNPQYLGYVNPRISDAASDITTDYEEHAEFVKLVLPDGEIDFVVSRNLPPRIRRVDADGSSGESRNCCGDRRKEDVASRRSPDCAGLVRSQPGDRTGTGQLDGSGGSS